MIRRSKKSRVYAFIDSQNLNVSVQRNGWKMDWKKFRLFLSETLGVTEAFMFIGYVPEYESLYEQMHNAGYMVVLKPTFDMTRPRQEFDEDKTGKHSDEEKKPVKGNIDADLVLWAMKEMKNYDKAIIVSGDGDFYTLVEYLHEEGKLLKLLTPGSHYSNLYNRFDAYIDRLDHHKNVLAYYDKRNKSKNFTNRNRSGNQTSQR